MDFRVEYKKGRERKKCTYVCRNEAHLRTAIHPRSHPHRHKTYPLRCIFPLCKQTLRVDTRSGCHVYLASRKKMTGLLERTQRKKTIRAKEKQNWFPIQFKQISLIVTAHKTALCTDLFTCILHKDTHSQLTC